MELYPKADIKNVHMHFKGNSKLEFPTVGQRLERLVTLRDRMIYVY